MMTGLCMPIKDALKRLRKAAEMTQQALAIKAGLSISAVIHIEAGRIPDPRSSTLHALAKALGVKVDDLLDDDTPPAEPAPPVEKKPRRKKGGGE